MSNNTAVPVLLMQHFEDGVAIRTDVAKKTGVKPRCEGFWPGAWQRDDGSVFLVMDGGATLEGSPDEIVRKAANPRKLQFV